jgi:hypothetical protein
LVERTVRDREVGGSNPLAPTISLLCIGTPVERDKPGFIFLSVNPAKQRMFQCEGDEIPVPVKTQFLGDRG